MFRFFNLIYALLYVFIGTLFFPKEFLKRPKKLRKKWLLEKFGFIEEPHFEERHPIIWIHAVSVGEILAISPLIKALAKKYNLVLTTITDTGRLVAEKRFSSYPVKIYYLPFDMKGSIKRFLKKTRAQALLIAETELWPNLISVASSHIPVAIINGRLSKKSFSGYRHLSFYLRSLLDRLTLIIVQDRIYAERFCALGASPEKIHIVGNLKFDLYIENLDFPELKSFPHPIIIAGSTHNSEEELILNHFLSTIRQGTLILAPRHPERFEEVEKIILSRLMDKAHYFRFSTLTSISNREKPLKAVILFDIMGKLGSLYKICDLAIIGGSFIPHGGQNPLEALYWKKPVVTGPYMDNFPFVEELKIRGGIIQVDKSELAKIFLKLIKEPEKLKEAAERGYQYLVEKRGALEKTLLLLQERVLSHIKG